MGVVRELVRAGKPGTRPKVGDRVTMHYECRLKDTGKIVDSSKIKGRAAEFQIGTGRVIQGWDEGVMEMEDGEEAILRVTSDYAYGTSGRPPAIPPNADLEFTCELLAINESMVAASMRVKMEKIALEQEDEMIRQAQAEARREAGESDGPAETRAPAPKKRKHDAREKGKSKRSKKSRPKKSTKKAASDSSGESSDSSSSDSSSSSSSSSSGDEKRRSKKSKRHAKDKAKRSKAHKSKKSKKR